MLKNMLSVMGHFAANTADSLLHRNHTERMLMHTDLKGNRVRQVLPRCHRVPISMMTGGLHVHHPVLLHTA
jgi:hypothetical protein